MQHDPDSGSPHAAHPRVIRIFELLALVLLWNSGYKGARVLNTLYALELDAQPIEIGLLLSTYGLFPLLLAVYAGKVADRYGVRAPLLGGVIVSALGVLLPFLWPAFPALFVAAAVSGAGFIFVQVSMQSLTGSLGSGAARVRNINLYAMTVSVADFAGPVLAGFSIDQFGHVRTYLHLALLNAAAVLGLIYVIKRIPEAAAVAADHGRHRMMDLLRNRDLRRVLMASAVVMTGIDLFQLYLPIYGHELGLPASTIGLILGAFATAVFITRALLPALVRRFGEATTLLCSMLLASATFLLIPLFQSAFVLGLICFMLGLGLGLGQPLLVILTYNNAPQGRAGEALGLRIAINNSMHVVMPTAFGAVGSLLGLAPVFWVSAALIALGSYATRGKRIA
jgi:MFS family permease